MERKGKMVVLFVDIKAAFDSMNREILMEGMRKRGVREELVVRCKEVLRETVDMVGKGGGELWDGESRETGLFFESVLVYSAIGRLGGRTGNRRMWRVKIGGGRYISWHMQMI